MYGAVFETPHDDYLKSDKDFALLLIVPELSFLNGAERFAF
jgi:hypothetical protein